MPAARSLSVAGIRVMSRPSLRMVPPVIVVRP